MATLKVIRKRIASVKNTQKITKAMKMVAAAKLRRAQTRLMNARPYAEQVEVLLGNIARMLPHHPLFKKRDGVKRAEFLILTSDRGLCGGFNGNLLRRVEDFLKTECTRYEEVRIHMVGKKGRDFFRARGRELATVETGLYDKMNFEKALKIADDILGGYQEGRFDHCYLVSNRFKSAISQEVRIDRLLPMEPKPLEQYLPEYLYEPSSQELVGQILLRGVATIIHRAFLESVASEVGARMAAMENATNNCSDMIYRLTLQLNRARQAAITRELMDIVNGAEALK
ncbi:MAG: ATP synthase F1 subunit gamma [Deltaproteobacteria bacterium]|nr:ATP synthase F1 subunit gamma [Deltaproteobacteria bacterium]MBI4374342.1 ATP synthase F1 subunit gamma [Deltaproteobacteria bacterium]